MCSSVAGSGGAFGEIKVSILAPKVIIYSKSQALSLKNDCFAAMKIIKMLCDVVIFILTILKAMPSGLRADVSLFRWITQILRLSECHPSRVLERDFLIKIAKLARFSTIM